MENGSVEFAYKDGEATIKINCTHNNVADETCAQLAWWVMFENLTPDMIEAVDIIYSGDHGKGAFVLGSKSYVALFDNKQAQSFEI